MTTGLVAFLLAVVTAYGVFLVYTALAFRWRGVGPGPNVGGRRRRMTADEWLTQAGLEQTRLGEFAAVLTVLVLLGAAGGWAIWGGVIAPLAAAVVAGSFPVASARARRAQRRERAREAWPRMIEELRLQAVNLGRSLPQALFTVGLRGPEELQPAFRAAQREWHISTDFDRTLAVLKAQLVDPTADAICETLLIAHEVGGSDVDHRLRALIDDRTQDLQGRKDARSKQAGAKFARLFVLIVPIGMALVGLSIGEGRAAYETSGGQLAVLAALALIGVCWLWAGRLMRLPEEQRVFYEEP